MDLDFYQKESAKTAQYGGSGEFSGLTYVTMGLAGEAGEISNAVSKIFRDNNGVITEEHIKALSKEAGDVLWFLGQFVHELGLLLSHVAQANLDKLASRKRRGVIQGSGDDR